MNDEKMDFSVGNEKNPLRLLIMDSLADNAEVTANLVRKLGYTIQFTLIKDLEELGQKVANEDWDLMISPPRLADIGTSQILSTLTSKGHDIPLLILASNMSDQLVIDALQSGGRAVLAKESLDHFSHTLKRELEDLAQRRARSYYEKLSEEFRNKCENLMEQSHDKPAEQETGTSNSFTQAVNEPPNVPTQMIHQPLPANSFKPKSESQINKESDKKWEGLIHSALKENRFRLVFQPIVNLHSKPVENYEVLLRMLDKENKEISPAEFIPTAERCGLMPELDRWVADHAITSLATLRRNGKNTTFFIKLSGMTLNNKDFPTWLRKRLDTIKLAGDCLVFEISESIAITQPAQVKKFINWLKVLKCHSALDHFGTQPRSMDIMKFLPVDYIKIDGSFIHNLSENMNKVKSIVSTAHSMDKMTVAVFVEDANSLRNLWQCGVDYIQGYFLQQPAASMTYEFSEF